MHQTMHDETMHDALPPPPTDTAHVARNLARLRAEIAAAARASGRDADAVTLVAVSKTWPRDAVDAARQAGQVVFGENRVQEAAAKFARPGANERPATRLHLIGPLQTNKARDAVHIADVIESLDRPRLCDALADAIQREGRSPDLLVQVNTGREPQKAGVLPEDADRFIAACHDRFADRLRGLMCVPPAGQDPAPHFRDLAALAARHGLSVLSMGMSGDFVVAIECGATSVRIGSAVFGARL